MAEKYDNCLYKYLIQQCKSPSGIIGSKMNAIWNKTFHNMTLWGVRDIHFSSHDYILDIGCGGGATVKKLARFVSTQGKVYGIDASKTSVANSCKENKDAIIEGTVEIIHSCVEDMPFLSNTFDKVFAIQTHIYWSDISKGTNEILRILKPNGNYYIICEKDKIAYHLADYQEITKMIEVLKSVGFSSITYVQTEKWIKYTCTK